MKHELLKTTWQATALAALCVSAGMTPAPARAQTHAQTEAQLDGAQPKLLAQSEAREIRQERRVIVGGGEQVEFELGSPGVHGGERTVKGAPYCADAVHESVQWLQSDSSGAAPNRIVRQQTTRLCRDTEGRTRQEVDRGGRKLVYLRDPGTRENWVLDPERKTARRLGGPGDGHFGHLGGPVDNNAWREYAERMREWARGMADRDRFRSRDGSVTAPTPPGPPTAPAPAAPAVLPAPPAPVVITRIETINSSGGREAEVRMVRPDVDSPLPPVPGGELAPPAVQFRAMSLAPRGAGSVSPLPPKDIDGLRANGERTSWVIDAGKIGNEKPIQITREVWTSPELMVTLSSRDFDPRSGEQNYRLKNLKRGEPEAALMRVPGDYTKQAVWPAPRAPGANG